VAATDARGPAQGRRFRPTWSHTGLEIHGELTEKNAGLLGKGLDEIEGEPSAAFTEAGKVLWAQMRAETEQAA
jgi:uncharacterized UPF0160 family protein